MHPISLGLKTWPQWAGWGICHQTGLLYDHHGNRYDAGDIAPAFMLSRAFQARDKLLWADCGPPLEPLHVRPSLTFRDVRDLKRAHDEMLLELAARTRY